MEIDALSTTTCELKGRRWPRPSAEPLRPPAASPRVSSRPPSMLHADVRTNIHSLSHLTPLTPPGRSPPKLGAKCAQFVDIALAPWRRRTEDDPFSSLRQDRCATPVRGRIRPRWQRGSQHGQTTCRARHPFSLQQEASHHVFVAHLPEGSWQGRESPPPCCVRH